MSFSPFSFQCPYCGHCQAVTQPHYSNSAERVLLKDNEFGNFGFALSFVSCANPDCKRVSASIELRRYQLNYTGAFFESDDPPIFFRRILPQSNSKPQPDCIPAQLREDYLEACLIRDLSPKASATLCRRCLQGMIRDFAGISRSSLQQEINELNRLATENQAPKGVSEESIDAIDQVRKIGNIGAHFERDINVIVDVEPSEAQVLIELIEQLFEEWYVARDQRQKRFARLREIAEEKSALKSPPKA